MLARYSNGSLEDCDAIVTTVESADEALTCSKVVNSTFLGSDIGMPSENGYSFIKRVRSLSAASCGDIPAIALTALRSCRGSGNGHRRELPDAHRETNRAN